MMPVNEENIYSQYPAKGDYEILERNVDNLDFINGVALYYDNSATNRRIYGEQGNLNNMLQIFCKRKSVSFEDVSQFLRKLYDMVSAHFDANIQVEGLQLSEESFMELGKMEGLEPNDYYSYHEFFRFFAHINPILNNCSIVTKDGKFLMDSHFNMDDRYRFSHQIEINDYGLFQMEIKERSYYNQFHNYPGIIKESSWLYILDNEGNGLNLQDFKMVLSILSNRKVCYNPQDFVKMIPDLEHGKFEIVAKHSNRWYKKAGEYELGFNKEREDGLLFYTEDYSRPGSDSYTELQYVKDKEGNTMLLNDFYLGLIMLGNGKGYLSELAKNYLLKELKKFNKE